MERRDGSLLETVVLKTCPDLSCGDAEAGREVLGVFEEEGGGGISVFSTLVPLRLGLGAETEVEFSTRG